MAEDARRSRGRAEEEDGKYEDSDYLVWRGPDKQDGQEVRQGEMVCPRGFGHGRLRGPFEQAERERGAGGGNPGRPERRQSGG